MSATLTTPKTTSGGEIIRELINASDGAGLHFDGAAGNIDIASPPDLGTKFSFEFVIKADSTGTSGKIVDFGDGGRFVIEHNTTGLQVKPSNAGGWVTLQSPSPLADLAVHHLVLTVDGTTATLFDNGNQTATATISATDIDSCADAKIGSYFDSATDLFNGTIYRTRFYNKALTSAEVQTAYERADVDFADQYGSQTDYHTHSNAVSDHSTEANATTGWAANNSPITSQTTVKNVGSYAFKIDYNAGTNAPRASYTFSGKSTGKKYRLQFDYKHSGTGDSVVAGFGHDTYGGVNIVHTITASETSWTTKVYEFEDDGTNYAKFALRIASTSAAATTIYIDNFFLVQIGAVSDYDLAFANPTQSLTVQDRSGAADGTASASGVTQVQPVVQLNATAARIGTTAATPADGTVYIGDTTTTPLAGADDFVIARGSGDAGVTIRTADSSTGQICFADGNADSNAGYRGYIGYKHGTSEALNLGSGGTTAMSISSTGNVTVNGPQLEVTDSLSGAHTTLKLKNTSATASIGSQIQLHDHDSYFYQTIVDSDLRFYNGAERLAISADGQIGVGKLPSANQVTAYGPSVQVGQAAALMGAAGGNNLFLSSNALYNNSDWKLTNAGQAGQLFINTDGSFKFRQERTSGSADDNISWDDALTIDSTGKATSKAADNVFTVQDTEDTVANANAEVRIGESDASGNLNNYWGLKFAGTASGGDLDVNRNGTTALTISSTGLATFANGITVDDAAGGMAQIQTGGAITIADDASITLSTSSNYGSLVSVYEGSSGKAVLFFVTYATVAQIVSDPSSLGSASDTDGKICMIKTTNSHAMTFKNRLGSSLNFRIAQLGGTLT